jgi:hypothetical protein
MNFVPRVVEMQPQYHRLQKEKGEKEAKGLWESSSNKSLHGQARISEEFDLMKQFSLHTTCNRKNKRNAKFGILSC